MTTLDLATIEELEQHANDLNLPLRTHYHRIEARYPDRPPFREEVRGEWFQFAECRPMGIHDAGSVVALLNAAPALLSAARRVAELEREVARLKGRKFPVLMGADAQELRKYGCPMVVPWDFIADNAAFCGRNHGQSPESLAERGGLGPDEMCAIVEGRKWRRMTNEEAAKRLLELLAAALSSESAGGSGDG